LKIDCAQGGPAVVALRWPSFPYKILYSSRVIDKELRWVGSAYDDLLAFPVEARRQAGFQLSKVQAGLDPGDRKPFGDIGPGTREIRLREASGAFRVMYVVRFEEAVYVLHCFQKKTQATSPKDKHIAVVHYQAIVNARKDKS
jgi:phage-related protein